MPSGAARVVAVDWSGRRARARRGKVWLAEVAVAV
jgi:hypothetical protein